MHEEGGRVAGGQHAVAGDAGRGDDAVAGAPQAVVGPALQQVGDVDDAGARDGRGGHEGARVEGVDFEAAGCVLEEDGAEAWFVAFRIEIIVME